jgi:transmembrane sensor
MSDQEAKELLSKYEAGNCTDAEKALVEKWLFQVNKESAGWSDERLAEIRQEVWQKLLLQPERKIIWWPRMAAAASIILALSAGGYFSLHKPLPQIAQNHVTDRAPAVNKATLTLANGQKIILTKGLNGKLALQGNTIIQVNSGNAITYTAGTIANEKERITYNTLTTVRGKQSPYPLILSDGTKVWLNAASSITFPTSFANNDRIVKITGEVYFEVIHNAAHPFKVSVKGQLVEDIGTSFNINAYTDEPVIKTTLVRGEVKVVPDHASLQMPSITLKPGEQSVLAINSDKINIVQADMDESLAWRQGLFRFNDESLESILRQVSRWYDVDIDYTDVSLKSEKYVGIINRFSNISKVLHMLEETGDVHFQVSGNKVLVSKRRL